MKLICPVCQTECEGQKGWRMHMSKSHGGYDEAQSKGVGLTGSSEHLKGMAGFPTLADAKNAAPATEQPVEDNRGKRGPSGPRQPRMTADEARSAMLKELFEKNKSTHLRRWERKIRMIHRLHEMLGATRITDEEVVEGAELHYELCVVMEWFTYSKYEVMIDLTFWWVRTIVEHDPHAQQFIAAWRSEQQSPDLVEVRNSEGHDGTQN